MRNFIAVVGVLALAGCNILPGGERGIAAEAIVDEVPAELAATDPTDDIPQDEDIPTDDIPEETAALQDEPSEEAEPRRRRGGLFGLLGGGNKTNSRRNRPGTSAADFIGTDVAVTPGLASCVTAIGRPDLAMDPNAEMTNSEIADLLACTSERAKR